MPSEAPTAEIPGISLGGVRGRGGFADVFAAQMDDGRAIALKLMRRPADARAQREIDILRRLGPTIAPELFDSGTTTDGRRWIAMEDLGHASLGKSLADRREIDFDATMAQLDALASAIDQLHEAGFAHRDLKPENLFYRQDGSAVIIDYGLARPMDVDAAAQGPDPSLTRTGERMGTLHYMAPEQWEDARSASAPADLYALGVIAYEMLTGRPPFAGDPAQLRHRHASERCPPASANAPVSRAVDRVFERALAKNALDRYPSARAMASELRHALAAAPKRATTPVIEVVEEQPHTALVALFSGAPANRIAELANSRGATVVGIEQERYLLAMTSASSTASGVRDADRLAREAVATGLATRAVVHAEELVLRTGRRGRVMATGAALRDADHWAAAGDSVIGHTIAVRRYLRSSPTLADANRESQFAPMDPESVELLGREPELHAARDAITIALEEGRPILASVVGEAGAGKTRFLGALARQLRVSVPHLHYLKPDPSDPDRLVRRLLRIGLALDGETLTSAAIESAWGEHLPSEAAQCAALHLLGAETEAHPAVAALLDAPGALRQATARAIAAAMLRLASQSGVAVLIDDAHAADHAVLDGIELATMESDTDARAPLAIVVGALPSLSVLRESWADRAACRAQIELARLEAEAARGLLRALLHPIEFVPIAVIDRLVELAAGVPGDLVELAEAVRESGSVHSMESTQGFVVASDELLDVATRPLAERIGRHALENTAGRLAPLLSACAVLDRAFTVRELCQLQDHLPADDPLVPIDIATGLGRLAERKLLRPAGQSYRLRSALLAAGLEHATSGERLRSLHLAALKALQSRAKPGLEQLARHAAGSASSQIAAESLLELGDLAMTRHRYVEAEQRYNGAIDHAEIESVILGHALAGRGRSRYRLQRFEDAVADLEQARGLAAAMGDEAEVVRLLLEEATAMDWYADSGGSRERVEQAAKIATTLEDPVLHARVQLGLGRSLNRESKHSEAVSLLRATAAQTEKLGLYEAHVIALLMLGDSLSGIGEDKQGEAILTSAIALCQRVGDDFHLAAAHSNRGLLCSKRQELAAATADFEASTKIGRRLGNAALEWFASMNLAELRIWRGDFELARALIERAFHLAESLSPANAQATALTMARLYAAQGDPRSAEQMDSVDTIETDSLTGQEKVLAAAVRLSHAPPAAARGWSQLLEDAGTMLWPAQRMEILLMAAVWARAKGPTGAEQVWIERARVESGTRKVWQARLRTLEDSFASSCEAQNDD